MAKKLYADGKYIIADFDDGSFLRFPMKFTVIEKELTTVSIQNTLKDESVGIADADAGDWQDAAVGGTPYTPATLLTFLLNNTANFSEAVTSLEDIPDVPAYSGNAGNVLTVNGTEDGTEWTAMGAGGGDILLIRIDGTTPLTYTILRNDLGLSITGIATGAGTYVFFGGAGNFAEARTKYYLPQPKFSGSAGALITLVGGGDSGAGTDFFIVTKTLEPNTAAVVETDNLIDGQLVMLEMNL